MHRTATCFTISATFPLHRDGLLVLRKVVDHILGDIPRVFPCSPDTLHDIPKRNCMWSFQPHNEGVDLIAERFECPKRFDIPVCFFHVIVKKRDDAPLKNVECLLACFCAILPWVSASISFSVTPMVFSTIRSAWSPIEFLHSLCRLQVNWRFDQCYPIAPRYLEDHSFRSSGYQPTPWEGYDVR